MMQDYEIINVDCLRAMQEMPDGCFDAIVTDPPYGLAFMGANWDHNVPSVPYWSECLRVAKPGAHLLCFGGTRTFHRLMCAIEDAGWEIRDTIMWVYGCLDEETEILVDGEFVPYNKAKIGSLALGYDIERGTFSWQRIEDTYLYDYDDTAYAIQSDSTDQLVSRNHRCIVERGGVEQFAFAEQVAQEREACVPVLEGLQGLLDHLPLPHEGAGDEKQDVLEGVRGEGGESRAEEAQGARAEHDMPSMREGVLHTDGMEAQGSDKLLLKELQGQGGKCTSTASVQQGTPDTHGGREKAEAKRADDWTSKPVMEGRGDVSAQPRELQGCEVRQVPQGVLGDGTQGRVRDGAQACGCPSNREAADKAGMRASRQSRPVGQQAGEPDAVPVERGSQDLRELWGAKSTLARVTPTHYKGKMWCVKVRTGAFVARRHGKIFVTGNSGFPKSMDVGKAIDKALGAERKVIGEHPNPAGNKAGGNSLNMSVVGMPEKAYITEPTTEQVKEWDGWGTCLKPAWEPIIVARKPLDGTVAHNVMTHGTGAINIDGCRVPTNDRISGGAYGAGLAFDSPWMHDEKAQAEFIERKMANYRKSETMGRFPANLVHDGSQEVLELFPDSKGQQGKVAGNEPSRTGDNGIYGHYGQRNEFVPRGDSGSAARFFYCAKASKKDRNSGCEDLLTWEHDQELTRLLEQSSQLLKDISECTTLSQGAERCSTSLFGNSTMGLSQTECRFITSTVIKLTTESKTCDSSQRLSINESILDAIRTSEESGISLARLADKLRSLRLDSTKEETDSAINAVSALFDALSEIRNCARKGNLHPTVKPNALMRWLVRLVCPQGGTVLDPFMGSGSTGVACVQEGMRFVGVDMDEHYCEIANARISKEADAVFCENQ